jgi:2-phosphosulfolactate phosphatase
MRVDVVLLPAELEPKHLQGRVVVVFEVLRATTTMAAALEAGVKQILIFPDVESVRRAKGQFLDSLSCGEQNCLKPEGFDLGNSPEDLGALHAEKTLLMSTTNGTKAILAARGAAKILIGALVNAKAVAAKLSQISMDVTLLCAGTNGKPAMEDMIGAGAVIVSLGNEAELESNAALFAKEHFRGSRDDLVRTLRTDDGGQNMIRAKLERDIDFAARLVIFSAVGEVVDGDPIRVVRAP